MIARVEEVSKITAKGQTTVPKAVRQALGVDYGGHITFRVERDVVTVRRADEDDADPVIDQFLTFLAGDLKRHPETVVGLSRELSERLLALVGEAEVNLDSTIDGDVDI